MIQLKVNFPVTEELALEAASRYPSYELVEKTQVSRHLHPLSSVERRVVEIEIFQRAKQDGMSTLVDIGGNVMRHAMNDRSVHSCNPVLSPEDNNRNSRFEKCAHITDPSVSHHHQTVNFGKGNVTFCYHTAHNCDCIEPEAYVSIHSLYYFGPLDVLDLVYRCSKGVLYAAAHTFNDLIGDYFKVKGKAEAHYEFCLNGDVQMSVDGNATSYRHNNVEWLRSAYFEVNGQAMSWSMDTIGETQLIVFRRCVPLTRRVPSTISDVLADCTYYGEMSLDLKGELIRKSGYEFGKVMTSKVFSIGKYLLAYNLENKSVLIPKGMVDKIACAMIGKERNSNTWQECIKRTREAMSEKRVLMPESLRASGVLYVASIAFVKYIDEEITITNAMLLTNKKKFGFLSQLQKFNPLRYCGCGGISTDDPVERYNNNNGSSSMGGSYINNGKEFRFTNVNRELVPVKASAKIDVGDYVPPKERSFVQIGVGFRDHIPVVPNPCQEHEIIAVNNRACKKTPLANSALWDRLTEPIRNAVLEEIEPVPYEEWNSSFPPSRQKEHNRAKLLLEENGLLAGDLVRKAFIKVEKYNKSTMDGSDDYDPRLIQGVSHKANVALGPFMSAVNMKLKRLMGPNRKITYASGMTGEAVGKWMSRALSKISDPIFFWSDYSRFDSTQGKGCFNHELEFYDKLGLKNHYLARMAYMAQMRTVGYTTNGVKYRVEYTRKSGDPNTSCGNSYINGSTCAQTLLDLGLTDFRILVLGDDMICVLDRKELINRRENFKALTIAGVDPSYVFGETIENVMEVFKQQYESFMLAYGFVPESGWSDDLCDAEFCSGLFWPCEAGYVLGPKVGRLMPKMGYSVKKLDQSQILGVFMGYSYNCNHVPLLNDFVLFHLRDAVGVVPTRESYKINCNKRHHMTEESIRFFEKRYDVNYYAESAKFAQAIEGQPLTILLQSGLLDPYVIRDN